MSRRRATTRGRGAWASPARGRLLIALTLALGACGDHAPAPPAPPASTPDPAGPAIIEVLSAGTYRVDGEFADLDGLKSAFFDAGRGRTDEITDPLVIVVAAALDVADAMPAFIAAMQPPGRTNLTLRVIEKGAGREATVPVLSGCLCRAIGFYDGGEQPFDHDSGETYVIVEARIADDGMISAFSTDVDAPSPAGETSLPDRFAADAPQDGEPLDLAALRTWFDALEAADLQPLLCLDYRDTLPAGHLVDALIATKRALGLRVLLGPNPREPELEEELDDTWDDE